MSEARKNLLDKERKELKNKLEKGKWKGAGSEWTTEEEAKRLAEIKRLEERNKEMWKAKKEEYKRLINREVGTLKSMEKDEEEAAIRYRNASNDSPLPTMKRLLLDLGSEEQTHALRLHRLAIELERGIL